MYYLEVKKLFYNLDPNYSVNVLHAILSIFRCQIRIKLNQFTLQNRIKFIQRKVNTNLNGTQQLQTGNKLERTMNNVHQSQIQFTSNVVHLFQQLNQFGFE
ncbi:Hypothetical_protein [Hexamita inflata]|uniref:Hypothetical_protein n=1 Tax=Hexamita inflata TaxID=28002 RepID=A0AA86UZQ7_9EUKA|nr:Hypothetical protein HINF_LOCUS58217 [Hexamita inflata]